MDQEDKTTTVTSGTETIQLPEQGFLSQVNLRAAALSVWADEAALPVYHIIKKVELLVNGSQVVKSLSGRQIRALAWYHGMDLTTLGDYARGSTGEKSFWTFPLLLGTKPYDELHMLDLSRYSNPLLKITWDATDVATDGISWDITASPAFRYGVDLVYYRGTPGAVEGYVKSSEIDSWTSANSLVHSVDVPRGQNLIGLSLEGRYTLISNLQFFNKIKLDFNNGEWVPINHNWKELRALYSTLFPRPCQVPIYKSVQDGDTHDFMVGDILGHSFISETNSLGPIYLAGAEFPIYTINCYRRDADLPHTTRADVHMMATGYMPHQMYYLPMWAFYGGDWSSIPTASYGKIKLESTLGSGAGANATMRACAEYLVPNGQ